MIQSNETKSVPNPSWTSTSKEVKRTTDELDIGDQFRRRQGKPTGRLEVRDRMPSSGSRRKTSMESMERDPLIDSA